MIDNIVLGKMIKDFRDKKGLTQDQLADMVAEGETINKDECESSRVISVDLLQSSDNAIDKAIFNAFNDSGTSLGYVYYEIDNNGYILFAQWSESDNSGVVGQYPDPETDPEAVHILGSRF